MSLQISEYSEASQTGVTLPLEFELEEDVEAELHHFVSWLERATTQQPTSSLTKLSAIMAIYFLSLPSM
jgi:hypothetical protein